MDKYYFDKISTFRCLFSAINHHNINYLIISSFVSSLQNSDYDLVEQTEQNKMLINVFHEIILNDNFQ